MAVITQLIPVRIRSVSMSHCAIPPLLTFFFPVCARFLLRSVRDDFGSLIGKCQGKTLSLCIISHILVPGK